MCHAHSARRGPLESIPKSRREEALHLNSRLASDKKGGRIGAQGEEEEKEEDVAAEGGGQERGKGCGKNRGSSSLTVFEQQQTSVSSCTKTRQELILNISVTRRVGLGLGAGAGGWLLLHSELLEGFRGQRGRNTRSRRRKGGKVST